MVEDSDVILNTTKIQNCDPIFRDKVKLKVGFKELQESYAILGVSSNNSTIKHSTQIHRLHKVIKNLFELKEKNLWDYLPGEGNKYKNSKRHSS